MLLNLGREDGLDRDGLARLVASINRYLGEPAPTAVPPDVAVLVGDGLRVAVSRPMHRTPARCTVALPRRSIDPASKLAAAEWASCDVAIPGLEAMDEDQAYRAMDLLVEADAEAKVQEAVFFTVADLLNLEVDLLLSTPPPPTSNATPRRTARMRSAGTGTPRTTAPTCPRS